MKDKVEKKHKNMNRKDITDYDEKIEIATQTLERNIGFVTSCDNKTSIVLAILGVFLTIILTNDSLNTIYDIFSTCIEAGTFCDIIYLLLLIGAILIMFFGIYNLCGVLIAKTSEVAKGQSVSKSRIFFTGISEHENCEVYRKRFYKMSEHELLDELITQIYRNAEIARQKYKMYNHGVKLVIIGGGLFVVILLIGIYLY